jgi:CheY-like chemotaxis protein
MPPRPSTARSAASPVIEGFGAVADSPRMDARVTDIREWQNHDEAQRVVLVDLANDVADEFSALLTVIAAHERIAKGTAAADSLYESVAAIRASAARATATATRLLAFATGSVHREPAAILVIDPDDVMRELMVKLLKREGYRVLEARTVAQGCCVASRQPVDLLVSNIASSPFQSDDAIGAMMAKHPTMKHLCIAASTEMPQLSGFDRRTTVLRKPLSSVTLVESVRATLG